MLNLRCDWNCPSCVFYYLFSLSDSLEPAIRLQIGGAEQTTLNTLIYLGKSNVTFSGSDAKRGRSATISSRLRCSRHGYRHPASRPAPGQAVETKSRMSWMPPQVNQMPVTTAMRMGMPRPTNSQNADQTARGHGAITFQMLPVTQHAEPEEAPADQRSGYPFIGRGKVRVPNQQVPSG